MGIGLATALLLASALFGSESAFINPAAKADVKKYILDKDRQVEVLDLMKTYESEFKAGRKKEKKQEKALEKLFEIRGSEMADFQSVCDDYMNLREIRQLSYFLESLFLFLVPRAFHNLASQGTCFHLPTLSLISFGQELVAAKPIPLECPKN